MVFMVWDIYIMTATVHYSFLVQRWGVSPWGVFRYFSLKHAQPPVSSWLCISEIAKWAILTTSSYLLNKINWFNNLVAGLLFLQLRNPIFCLLMKTTNQAKGWWKSESWCKPINCVCVYMCIHTLMYMLLFFVRERSREYCLILISKLPRSPYFTHDFLDKL